MKNLVHTVHDPAESRKAFDRSFWRQRRNMQTRAQAIAANRKRRSRE